MELQHIIGQPQTYTVSPTWKFSEEGSCSSGMDVLHPVRIAATTMAMMRCFTECPYRCMNSITRTCFGSFDGSKRFISREPQLTLKSRSDDLQEAFIRRSTRLWRGKETGGMCNSFLK